MIFALTLAFIAVCLCRLWLRRKWVVPAAAALLCLFAQNGSADAGCFSSSAVVVAPAVTYNPFFAATFATGNGFTTAFVPTNAAFASPFAVGISPFFGSREVFRDRFFERRRLRPR